MSDARQPAVSVIMNCLNGEKYLREALDSVYAQTYADWEIVFWDNASSDRSGEIARSYQDGRLRYFRGESTVPLGRARNLAIEQSRGALIAFLDCDDLWLPSKLERQVPLFLADPAVGLVYSDTCFFNDAGMEKRLFAIKTPCRGYRFEELLNDYAISLETAVVRRAALDSLDFWFDSSFSAIEEYDLFVRLALRWKVDFVPEVLARWRVHGDSWTWRTPEAFSREGRTMLERLGKSPDVARAHSGALARAWHGNVVSEAHLHWRRGDGRAARRVLRDNAALSGRSARLWLASFLPYGAAQSVRRWLQGTVVPVETPAARARRPRELARMGVLTCSYPALRLAGRVGRSLGWSSPNRLRVLLYHDVAPNDRSRFAQQLRWLSRRWTFITPDRFEAMVTGEEPISGSNLLLTFDDGFASQRLVAEETLGPMGIRAVFFVVSDFVALEDGREARQFIARHIVPGARADDLPQHWRNMGWPDLDALLESGHTIGAHTRTHARLSQLATRAEQDAEIAGGADALERRLGVRIEHFAYPFGDITSFSQNALAAARRRFRFVHSGLRGDNVGATSLAVRRDAVEARDPNAMVGALLEGAVDRRYERQRGILEAWSRSASEVPR